jgi:hypothetical protein
LRDLLGQIPVPIDVGRRGVGGAIKATFGGAGGLVVVGGVEGEVAQQFAVGGVEDSGVQVVDEDQDAGSGVGSADADLVRAPVDAQVMEPAWSTRSVRTRS